LIVAIGEREQRIVTDHDQATREREDGERGAERQRPFGQSQELRHRRHRKSQGASVGGAPVQPQSRQQ